MKMRITATALAVWGMCAILAGPAWTAALTIGNEASVYVRGGASISPGCQDITIEAGGSMYIDHGTGPGKIYQCRKIIVNPGGYFYKGDGSILHCSVIPEIMILLMD